MAQFPIFLCHPYLYSSTFTSLQVFLVYDGKDACTDKYSQTVSVLIKSFIHQALNTARFQGELATLLSINTGFISNLLLYSSCILIWPNCSILNKLNQTFSKNASKSQCLHILQKRHMSVMCRLLFGVQSSRRIVSRTAQNSVTMPLMCR